MPLHILLADDHVAVREWLRDLLERAGYEVVGEAGDGQQAINMAEEFHPDVAIVDVLMPLLNGIDAAREIRKVCPQTKTILLTMYPQDGTAAAGLRAGICGVISKDSAAEELLPAIHAVCEGGTYLSLEVSKVVLESLAFDDRPRPPNDGEGRHR